MSLIEQVNRWEQAGHTHATMRVAAVEAVSKSAVELTVWSHHDSDRAPESLNSAARARAFVVFTVAFEADLVLRAQAQPNPMSLSRSADNFWHCRHRTW